MAGPIVVPMGLMALLAACVHYGAYVRARAPGPMIVVELVAAPGGASA